MRETTHGHRVVAHELVIREAHCCVRVEHGKTDNIRNQHKPRRFLVLVFPLQDKLAVSVLTLTWVRVAVEIHSTIVRKLENKKEIQ